MSWNGFESLDLTDVNPEQGSQRLTPGSYRVKVTSADLDSDGGNKKLIISMEDEDGNGDIRHVFNIVHKNTQAQEIARSQLKGFLIAAGHPNPDKPGDVKTIKGLKCAISVGMGKPYTNASGNRIHTTEVKKFMSADSSVRGPTAEARPDLNAAGSHHNESGGGRRQSLEDEIPF